MDVQHVIHVEDQVFGSNGEKIATVRAVTPAYLHATSGLFGFGHDYYIPYDMVQEVEPGIVVLKVPADRVGELGWTQPPAAPTGRAPFGHYGTMPAPPVELAPLAPSPPPETSDGTAEAAVVEARGEPASPAANRRGPSPGNVCGHQLHDVNGQSIGKIRTVSPEHATVSTGVFGLGPTLYVPLDQITRCEGDYCFVTLTREQVYRQGWTHKPNDDRG